VTAEVDYLLGVRHGAWRADGSSPMSSSRVLPEDDGFGWPRSDGLKWPHFGLVDVLGSVWRMGGVEVVRSRCP